MSLAILPLLRRLLIEIFVNAAGGFGSGEWRWKNRTLVLHNIIDASLVSWCRCSDALLDPLRILGVFKLMQMQSKV